MKETLYPFGALILAGGRHAGQSQPRFALRSLACVIAGALLTSCATSPDTSVSAAQSPYQFFIAPKPASVDTSRPVIWRGRETSGLELALASADVQRAVFVEQIANIRPIEHDDGWVSADSPDGRFTVSLPGPPRARTLWFDQSNADQPISAESVVEAVGRGPTVVVTRIQYLNDIEAQRQFQGTSDAFKAAGWAPRRMTFRGRPAVEVKVGPVWSDSPLAQRVILLDGDIFWLTVLGRRSADPSANSLVDDVASKVFDSLRFESAQINVGPAPGNAFAIRRGEVHDLGPENYADKVRRRVRPHMVWAGNVADLQTIVAVRCAPSGTLLGATVARSSGNDSWDAAALRAVQQSDPMPVDVNGKALARFMITLRPNS